MNVLCSVRLQRGQRAGPAPASRGQRGDVPEVPGILRQCCIYGRVHIICWVLRRRHRRKGGGRGFPAGECGGGGESAGTAGIGWHMTLCDTYVHMSYSGGGFRACAPIFSPLHGGKVVDGAPIGQTDTSQPVEHTQCTMHVACPKVMVPFVLRCCAAVRSMRLRGLQGVRDCSIFPHRAPPRALLPPIASRLASTSLIAEIAF